MRGENRDDRPIAAFLTTLQIPSHGEDLAGRRPRPGRRPARAEAAIRRVNSRRVKPR